MTTNVLKLNAQMRKAELIHHLEIGHPQAVAKRIEAHRWTKAELVDIHRLIHLGLGK